MALQSVVSIDALTTALVFGLVAGIALLLLMNRGHAIFINLKTEEEPFFLGLSITALVYGALADSRTALVVGGVFLLLTAIARFTSFLNFGSDDGGGMA